MRDEWEGGPRDCQTVRAKEEGRVKTDSNRHDYALKPYGPTALDALKEAGYDVISIGKIKDIFDGEGITRLISHRAAYMEWSRPSKSWIRISTACAS